jgi:hypothetical protein
MLPLDDDGWGRLTTFFGEPEELPSVLAEWLASIGTDREADLYRHELFDVFLHQVTITNVAFAIVPYLVDVCKHGKTAYRAEYLTDVALVEACRLKYGVYFNRDGTDDTPAWLMADYHGAIAEARSLVDDVIDSEQDEEWKRGLVATKPALYGDAELAWSQW